MAAFVGMDPAAIRRMATTLGQLADQLDQSCEAIQRLVDDAIAGWEGGDAQEFHLTWGGEHRSTLQQAVLAVRTMAASAEEDADEQDRASTAAGGTGPGGLPFVGPVPPGGPGGQGGSAGPAGPHGQVPSTPAAPPPANGTPADNAAWWNSLTPAQQAQILAEHPEMVGNRDGIPGSVRDQANRALLPQYRADLERQLEEARANDGLTDGLITDSEVEILEDKLEALDEIERVLALGDRQLLVLDPTGEEQLKAAIAVGDVDTADHIAVFTPGLTSNVQDSLIKEDGEGGYDRDMMQLRSVMDAELDAAGRGDETTATVTWMGYEAPQLDDTADVLSFDEERSVAASDLAEAGGKDLAGFYRGLNEARGGEENVHLTAIGHSYGSTTTGYALQHGTGVDDAVFLGSPGVGTDRLSDLHLDEGHAFNMEASSDEVGDLGRFGGDPDDIRGLDRLSTSASGGLSESEWHSQYLVDQSTPQHNVAVVAIGGDPDRLVQTDESDAGLVGSLTNHGLELGRDGAHWAGDRVADGAGAVKDGAGAVVEGGKKLWDKAFGD